MRRAFTLIEVLLVAVVFSIMLAPWLALSVSEQREFRWLATELDRKTEAQLLVGQVMRRGSARIAPDNHGLAFADGSSVRWDGSRLWLKEGASERRLGSRTVTEFAVVRLGSGLLLTLGVEGYRQVYRR